MSIDRARFLPDLVVEGASILPAIGPTGEETTVQQALDNLDKVRPVSPEDFGAVGDGVADDTASMQLWAANGGKIAMSPRQVYRVTDTINFEQSCEVDGQFAKIIHDSAAPTAAIKATGLSRILIKNFVIEGRKDLKPDEQTEAYGIHILECEDVTVTNNFIADTHEHGIGVYATDDITQKTTSRVIITNNNIFGVGNIKPTYARGCGIWCFGYVNNLLIANNIISDSVEGIAVDDASGSGPPRVAREVLMANNIISAYRDGIRFESSAYGAITGNLITIVDDGTGYRGSAVCALMLRAIQTSTEPTKQVTVVGNTVTGPQFGAFIDACENVILMGNVIVQSNPFNVAYSDGQAGVRLALHSELNNRHIRIAGNDVTAQSFGIQMGTRSGATGRHIDIDIVDNAIKCTAADVVTGAITGVRIIRPHDVNVEGNRVEGFFYGIDFDTTDAPANSMLLIERNKIKDCSRAIAKRGANPLIVRNNRYYRITSSDYLFYSGSNDALTDVSGNVSVGSANSAMPSVVAVSSGNVAGRSFSIATAAEIAAAASAINTTGKFADKVVRDTTNNRLLVARGSSATSAWDVVDGSVAVTPV